ncbi:MAG: hypothetical protein AAB316_17835, partial [Bacteroidota bacterium]
PRASLYHYDVLNRIKASMNYGGDASLSAWLPMTDKYRTAYAYDANGNITTLQRHDGADPGGILMDDLSYTYKINPVNNEKINQLAAVADAVAGVPTDGVRGDLVGTHQYVYDKIGNLTKDEGWEHLDLNNGGTFEKYKVTLDIAWNVYGKVRQVDKTIENASLTLVRKEKIRFAYDPNGNRTLKEYSVDADNNGQYREDEISATYYVRDVQGNPMAMYERKNTATANPGEYEATLTCIERPIYGSDRIGIDGRTVELAKITYLQGEEIVFDLPADGYLRRSEYQNWLTSSNRSIDIEGTEACEARITQIWFDPGSNDAFTSNADLTEFMGTATNGVAVAENFDGEAQFYVVLAENYLGVQNACLVYDRHGNLLKGSEQIGDIEPKSKPVVVQLPGGEQYAIVTLNASQQPEYHVVDMSLQGYGDLGEKAGELTLANQPIDLPAAGQNYGWHFTGYEDHLNGRTLVYHTRYTPPTITPAEGTTEVLVYELQADASVTPQVSVVYSLPTWGDQAWGELQLSPDGKSLAWYRHGKNISAFAHREGRLHLLALSPDKLTAIGLPIIIEATPAGNYGDGATEWLADSQDGFLSQRGVYLEDAGNPDSDKNIWRYLQSNPSLLTSLTDASANPYQEIRRGADGNFYDPQLEAPATHLNSYDAAAGQVSQETLHPHPFLEVHALASGLPVQVLKVGLAETDEDGYARYVGEKKYELKDHLGNVRVVVSDEKTGEVDNGGGLIGLKVGVGGWWDYYPFGMGMLGRSFEGRGFRFGFGNYSKVNEMAGFGNHYTSKFWEYCPRIARRWNLDPIDQVNTSNYATFRNNPIFFIDPNGARSFYSYYAYKKYAKANNLKVLSKTDIWQQGHWLNEDVQYKLFDFGKPTFNDRYKKAAQVNIKNNASGEYGDLNERRELYDIADQFSKSKGSEVRWMNAAEKTVSTLNWALSPGAELIGKSNKEIGNFINNGNKAILDDMMPRINKLLSGSPIKGDDAIKWDAQTLADEQNLIQPFYESLSNESRNILQKNLESAYDFKGDIMNANDRWELGMKMMGYKNATSDKMPDVNGDYKSVNLRGIAK